MKVVCLWLTSTVLKVKLVFFCFSSNEINLRICESNFELNSVDHLVVARQESVANYSPVTFLELSAKNIRKNSGKKWNFQTKQHLISCHSCPNLNGKTVHVIWYINWNGKIIGTNAELWEMVQNGSFRLWFTYENKICTYKSEIICVQPGENKLIDCHFQCISIHWFVFMTRSTDCSIVLVYKLSPFSYNWKWWYSGQ